MQFCKILTRSGNSLSITIPRDLVLYYDMKEGDFVELEIIKVRKK